MSTWIYMDVKNWNNAGAVVEMCTTDIWEILMTWCHGWQGTT